MNWQDYIIADEAILMGKPTIRGTRLSVEFLLERLADGWTEQDLLDNYPRLTKEALQAVFAYIHASMRDHLLWFPTTNLRQAS